MFVKRFTAHFGEGEQAINELPHFDRAFVNPSQLILTRLRKHFAVIFQHDSRESTYRANGGAQIMRNRIGEGFQLTNGGSELRIGLMELALDSLTIADVAYGAGDQHAFIGLDRAEADLNRKLGTVPAQAK